LPDTGPRRCSWASFRCRFCTTSSTCYSGWRVSCSHARNRVLAPSSRRGSHLPGAVALRPGDRGSRQRTSSPSTTPTTGCTCCWAWACWPWACCCGPARRSAGPLPAPTTRNHSAVVAPRRTCAKSGPTGEHPVCACAAVVEHVPLLHLARVPPVHHSSRRHSDGSQHSVSRHARHRSVRLVRGHTGERRGLEPRCRQGHGRAQHRRGGERRLGPLDTGQRSGYRHPPRRQHRAARCERRTGARAAGASPPWRP
jgi:hypothetical protein